MIRSGYWGFEMAYLSRVYLNPLRRQTQRFLRDPQMMHAAVLGGVPEQPVNQRVLWRLDSRPGTRAEVLVLTETMPSWEHLIEQGGWPQAQTPQSETAELAPLLAAVQLGRRFRLRATVNPVVSVGSAQRGVRGKVVPVKTRGQLAWFAGRLPSWGFRIHQNSLAQPSVNPVDRRRLEFTKRDKNRVTLETATFDALVVVEEVETVRRSLLQGVGRGKAYGCGLITLAPPTSP